MDEIVEPIVMQRMVNRVLKVIFWYVSKVDSARKREAGTQIEGEGFEAVGVGFGEVLERLDWEEDRVAVKGRCS
jgi:hypothetical protein